MKIAQALEDWQASPRARQIPRMILVLLHDLDGGSQTSAKLGYVERSYHIKAIRVQSLRIRSRFTLRDIMSASSRSETTVLSRRRCTPPVDGYDRRCRRYDLHDPYSVGDETEMVKHLKSDA